MQLVSALIAVPAQGVFGPEKGHTFHREVCAPATDYALLAEQALINVRYYSTDRPERADKLRADCYCKPSIRPLAPSMPPACARS
jgi:hypothetical protein